MKPVVEVQHPIQRIKAKPLAPAGNLLVIMNAGLFRDPRRDFLIAHTCGHELFEFSGVYPRKVEKHAVKGAVELVGPSAAGEFSPAFVQRSRGNDAVKPQRSPWTPRSNSRQVRSQSHQSFISHFSV
jgi:hypothetical protein